MIQLSLDIPTQVYGFFTLEKYLIGLSLYEIEGILGYEQGRLKQGADFYIVTPPNHASDFDRYGTSVFPGHKFENSNLQNAINTNEKRNEDLSTFRRKRLIKVIPLQMHIEAMAKYLSREDYQLIREVKTYGRSEQEVIDHINLMYRDNFELIQQVKSAFALASDIYKKNKSINDEMYPSAKDSGVPQWKLKRGMPARCICRLTDYTQDRYQKAF